jgi:hypothetical protein
MSNYGCNSLANRIGSYRIAIEKGATRTIGVPENGNWDEACAAHLEPPLAIQSLSVR